MTLWNPLNVFSSGQASSSDEGPSASFDPSRIGDPLGPPSPGPAVGFGDARIGTAAVGDPRRNPIGFAPPETESPSRFRTEISFRRHNELPRASTLPAERDDHASTAWQSPVTVEHDDVGGEALFEETPVADMSHAVLQARDQLPTQEDDGRAHRPQPSMISTPRSRMPQTITWMRRPRSWPMSRPPSPRSWRCPRSWRKQMDRRPRARRRPGS